MILKKEKEWSRLDNAGKIYPAIVTERMTTVFRISANLKKIVSTSILQKALDNTVSRYPYFMVKLRAGLFWHYLQKNEARPMVRVEKDPPCRRIVRKENNKFLFRVLVYHKRISVEFSHTLTDGTGGLEFLKTLISEYLSVEEKKDFPGFPEIRNAGSKIDPGEKEDSYLRYYKKDIPLPEKMKKAYHLPGPVIDEGFYKITKGIIDADEIKSLAREKNVTITEFFTALYLDTLQEYIKNVHKPDKLEPIRVLIPVNLRPIYPSVSMRNFFLSVIPGIDIRLGNFDFHEILSKVYHFMRVEVNEKYINQQIARNIGGEKNFFIRFTPLMVKIWFEKIVYRKIASTRHSGVLTNLGLVRLPRDLHEKVDGFEFVANPNPVTKINTGIITYGDKLVISMGSLADYSDIEKIFFRKLSRHKIDLKIETNY